MNCTNQDKPAASISISKLLAVALLLPGLASFSQAQQVLDLDTQISESKAYLLTLDESARACLDDSIDSDSCEQFRQAISTEQLSAYQALCAPLMTWREQLIMNNNDASAEASAELTLQRLLDVEFACGDKALVTRTEHVASAFAFIQNAPSANGQFYSSGTLSRVERDSFYQRQSVSESVDQNRTRLQRETDLQWRRLELENALRLQQQLQVDLRNPSLQ